MSASVESHGKRSCAVTGAGGYVGSRIVSHFRNEGWRVREMRHDQVARDPDHPDRIPFSLEKGVNSSDLQGMDALIHCAYDFCATRWCDIARINVDGSTRLFEAAQASGISRIVYLSTMSAFEGCRSLYGKAKLDIEETARRFGAVRVRPGLIYGDRPGGTVGALEKIVSISPVVPLVDDGRYLLYLAHEEDLCRLAHELCDRAELGDTLKDMRPITAAAEGPHSLREILERLARRRGRRVSFVPVPRRWILGLLRAAESVGLRAGFRSDSLISLVNQDPSPDFGLTRKMHTSFRPFDSER
jgi:nucleoside-diphosphate-sugar epimerase